MALKHIEHGSVAKSADLNDNFDYLEGLSTALNTSKANDNTVVHYTTAETISGNKTFTGTTTLSGNTTLAGENTISGDCAVSGDVELTGDTTINGEVIFGENMVLPSNFRYVVSYSGTMTKWKRLWSDGWCEQGGRNTLTNASTHETTITIDKMNTTSYDVQISIQHSGASNMDYIPYVKNMTQTSFTVYHNSTVSTRYCKWYVCGFKGEEE